MCRAVPLRVTRVEAAQVWVDADGRDQAVSLLVDDVCVGDYVYCHAGAAIERLAAEQALEVLALLAELDGVLSAPDFTLDLNP